MTPAKNLTDLRKGKGLSRQKLADAVGISVHTYIKYENGAVKPPYDTLCMLADYYNVTTDYLLGREKQEPTTALDQLFTEESLSDVEQALLCKYMELPHEAREAVVKFITDATRLATQKAKRDIYTAGELEDAAQEKEDVS